VFFFNEETYIDALRKTDTTDQPASTLSHSNTQRKGKARGKEME